MKTCWLLESQQAGLVLAAGLDLDLDEMAGLNL